MSGRQAVLEIPDVSHEVTEVKIAPEVVVAGDHPVILLMANSLSSMGVSVTLIHPYDTISELTKSYRPLMESDTRVEDGYAFLVGKLSSNQSVKIMNQAEIDEVSGWWGNFSVDVRQGEALSTLKTSGLALAYKGNPVLPESSFPEGIKSFTGFFAQLDSTMEEAAAAVVRRVAFILDVDTRDEKWATAIALRLGAYLKGFGTQVYILCRDLKVSIDEMEEEYRMAREAGILIFKYQELPKVEGNKPNMKLIFKDASAVSAESPLNVVLEDLDTVVVQEKIVPSAAQERILSQLRIPLEGGFVGPNNPQFIGRTPKKGVVVGGDTWYPEYPTDGYATAMSAAEELYKWVGKGTYRVDVQRVAEVDPSKCATCLTCYRICPHDSIRIERYGERNVYITPGEKEGPTWEAARVKVETCNGCGLCASECPAKAIQLLYYPDLEVLEFLEKN